MENMTTQRKSYRTRVKIMDAYIELMQKKDFDSITVKAIVEQANITRGTFYLYFSDIYEMVTYMEDSLLSDMPDTPAPKSLQFDKPTLPTYEDCQDNSWEHEWFEYYKRYQVQFNTLLGPHGDASFYAKVRKSLQNALLIRMRQDNMPEDHTRDYFVNILPDLYLLLAKEWTSKEHPASFGIHSITRIISTIRIGSRYRHYLESTMSLNHETFEEVAK